MAEPIIPKEPTTESPAKYLLSGGGTDLWISEEGAMISELEKVKKLDEKMARDKSVDFLEKYFFEKTGRRPMVLPVVVEV